MHGFLMGGKTSQPLCSLGLRVKGEMVAFQVSQAGLGGLSERA